MSIARSFDPWIGDRYQSEGLNGLRLLILGESQYDTDEDQPRPGLPTENAETQKIVQRLAIDKNTSFFTKITKLVRGYRHDFSSQEKADFWQRVAFYNFVQWWLPNTRIRPTPEMWQAAQAPFLQVLEELKPHLVLVLGIDLAGGLPPFPVHIVKIPVPHPSSYGWTYEPWATKVNEAMNAYAK
jgi:hypothetical protein